MLDQEKNWGMLLGYRLYVLAFFIFLAAPLVAAGTFAFNDSLFPALPWQGFTFDWFFNDTEPKLGMFHDRRLLRGLYYSFIIATAVSGLSVFVGTCNAFLFTRREFPAKNFFYIMMIVPLVIPGVILGISILVFVSSIANGIEESYGIELEFMRPGILLVVLGQFSFITTITTLVIIARLKKFDGAMEEAALNLGASRARVLMTITLPFLRPAMIAAGIVAFLVSFENFNTTLFLVGSESPLTITMFDRMAKVGSTPVLNAVSFFLIVGSGLLALISILIQRDRSSE
ncbi:ABC transporter permease [Oceanibacterium hippocampi]|uniref:Inner membrane ABC transporter permease protein YdcV n=1 Tax=Oceanibacterium hippocampi TaxID=745714 RepID=A0A1Y5TJX5_9PROT|nr:ABC transporter permease [Oceanibacterium hippocampi]SLN63690.1 Inner membrane ABC transporter permease protein YdcV [Oceanibacterium hippocampi]